MEEIPTKTFLALPDENAIPRVLPENIIETDGIYYKENNKTKRKWGFQIEGGKDIRFWYNDYKQLQKEKIMWVIIGALLGGVISYIVSREAVEYHEKVKAERGQQSGFYYCTTCNHRHRYYSQKGKDHINYKR